MFFQHLHTKKVKLNELTAMQRYLTAKTKAGYVDSSLSKVVSSFRRMTDVSQH